MAALNALIHPPRLRLVDDRQNSERQATWLELFSDLIDELPSVLAWSFVLTERPDAGLFPVVFA